MANIKSAIKRVQINEKKRQHNQPYKAEMRTEIKHVESFIGSNEVENAKVAFTKAIKKIDKAVQKGLIHRNNGDRQKSRLAKLIKNHSA